VAFNSSEFFGPFRWFPIRPEKAIGHCAGVNDGIQDMTQFIILPGSGGSGQAHWQTRWEENDPAMRRFEPSSWDLPVFADWHAALDRAVAEATEPPVLVAHSLSCLLVSNWQGTSRRPVKGAFLVGVPDPAAAVFPAYGVPFADTSRGRWRFPSLILASTDDPYGSQEYAEGKATQWGSGVVVVGPLGHINAQSGLGDWPEGRALLTSFAAGLG
jgi:predicted alpha/beta hydrolase family esterase